MRGLVFFLIFSSSPSLFSQDRLTTKDGKVIDVIIRKMDDNIIQYYLYNDSSEILFTREKTAFTKIEYVSFDELKSFLKYDDFAYSHFNKYERYKKTARVLGISTMIIFAGSVAVFKSIPKEGESPSGGVFYSFFAMITLPPILGITSLIVYAYSKKYKKKVLDIYGLTSHYIEDPVHSEIPQLKIGLVSTGVGLQIIF